MAVYTTDADGRITFFNVAAAEFWGRQPALGELWCGSLRLLWPDESPMRHDECPMAITLHEARPVRGGQAIAVRPDGSQVAFAAYPTPLFADDGELIGAVNVLVDVTDRQRAARALEASNAVKDAFLGLVSHELRTPVTTIYGNARLLQTRGAELDEGVRASMIADIATDADRLHAIVENLLHLTRLGSGTQPDIGAAGPGPRRRADRGVVPGSLSGEPHRLRRAPERGHRRCRRDVSRAAHREPARATP